jgi:hypothetical protein
LKDIDKIHFTYTEQISKENYLVWIKLINRYIVLDSKILKLIDLMPKLSQADFLAYISKSLKVNSSIAKKINSNILELLLDSNVIPTKKQSVNTPNINHFGIVNFYSFNNVIIKVSFDSEDTKCLIHPKYNHLELLNNYNFHVHYSIFQKENNIFIFKDDQQVGSWNKNEMHEFQGKFSMEFLCTSYGKCEHDWMGVFHASTISKNNKSIMFTGDSGNGKSTLVTILMANGYNIIADDFTPILRSDSKTYCFPTAISIKEKSFEMIASMHPVIIDLKEYYINELKGNVKYLPPITNKLNANCNSVVWVKYNKDSLNHLEEIPKATALQKFLPDAWISNEDINAKAFIKWVTQTNFYELKYSDNKKLISFVDSLFLD